MMDHGPGLPQDALERLERRKREALEAEKQSLEEAAAPEIERRVTERRRSIEERARERLRVAGETSAAKLAGMRSFSGEALTRLRSELDRRRRTRLAAEQSGRTARLEAERIARETAPATAPPAAEGARGAAAEEDSSRRVKSILRTVRNHMQRGDMGLAARSVAEGLELDAFNAELLELDAKIREAVAEDTFSGHVPAAPQEPEPARRGRTGGRETPTQKKKTRGAPPAVEPRPAAAPPPPAEPAGARKTRKVPAWTFSALAAALILAAASIVYFEYIPSASGRGTSLAVLPWIAPGDGADLEIFTHGLPEVVSGALAAGPTDISLLGYASSSNLAALDRDPVSPLIGLGYSHFLSGSLVRRDSRFQVRVVLTDSGGGTLWSAEYLRDTAGLLLIPREITHTVREHLGYGGSAGSTTVEVPNTEAYLLYLSGLQSMRRPSRSGAVAAAEQFRRAVELDPSLAPAHAGLSEAIIAAAGSAAAIPSGALDEAGRAAGRAIELQPGSASGHLALARVRIEAARYDEARAAIDSAEVRSPGDATVHLLRGLAYFRSGSVDGALQVLGQAYRLDPRNAEILDLLAAIHQVNKTFDRALWHRETAMHFSGDSLRYIAGPLSDVIILDPILALNQGHRVASACLRLLESSPRDYDILYSMARILQVTGDHEESRKYFEGLEAAVRSRLRDRPDDTRARLYLGLGATRMGRYADGIAIGEAALAADTANAEARYLLSRIYALQMYSPQTQSVDSAKQSRSLQLLRDALDRRFLESQLGSADLYNVYYQADIKAVINGGRKRAS